MKVALDISPLKSAHQFRGIGAYTKNLIQALEQESKRAGEQELKIDFVDFRTTYYSLLTTHYDLVHYPYFDLFWSTLPLIKKKKTVVTIHDVIPLVFPERYPPGIKGKLRLERQKLALKTVNAVICDSKNSKKDVVKYLGFPEDKIHVIYLAPGKEFRPITDHRSLITVKQKYHLPNQFILYVGDVNYNKNIPGLLKAFKKLQNSKTPNFKLVLVGKAFKEKDLKEAKEIVQLIKVLGLEKRVKMPGFITGQDLVAVYNLATVYCQPSFYEGFGLPVLEAMACGVPVVTSKKASLPEIVGRAAVLVDPDDISDIVNGLTVAIEDEDLREDLIQRGLKQAKKFSWKRTAHETYKVYQKVFQG